jgi:hypothetical protein
MHLLLLIVTVVLELEAGEEVSADGFGLWKLRSAVIADPVPSVEYLKLRLNLNLNRFQWDIGGFRIRIGIEIRSVRHSSFLY